MNSLSAITLYSPGPFFEKTLLSLTRSNLIQEIVIVSQEPVHFKMGGCRVLVTGPLPSQETLNLILDQIWTKYLLLLPETQQFSIEAKAIEKIVGTAESTRAGLVYSDFYDESEHGRTLHPLNGYQFGSVRDNFDFGPTILFSVAAIRKALEKYGLMPRVKFAGLYDLRLKISIDHSVYHLQEPLYSVVGTRPSLPAAKRYFHTSIPAMKPSKRRWRLSLRIT